MFVEFDCYDIIDVANEMLKCAVDDEERAECQEDLDFYARCEKGINVCTLEEFSDLLTEAKQHCEQVIVFKGGKLIYLKP